VRQTADPEGRMKILYIEDNDDNIYMLKNRLSRAGFIVVVATCPQLVEADIRP
jgi:CheY-like chemotaxis protein